ncbi:hypothetical protein JCM15765_02720 [Paradesulfitobacterium aromaticivorans]
MGFGDKLWQIAPPFLKRTIRPEDSDTWVWLQAIGTIFDKAKTQVFAVRRQGLVPTATGLALDWHGDDRRMPRQPGESDAAYQKRLLNFREYYLRTGTKQGILDALWALGYTEAEVYPLYKEKYKFRFLDGNWTLDGNTTLEPLDPEAKLEYLGKWSQLLIKLNIGDQPFLQAQRDVLIKHLNELKPPESAIYAIPFAVKAETQSAYLVLQTSVVTVHGSLSLDQVVLDGRKLLDNSWALRNRLSSSAKMTFTTSLSSLEQPEKLHLLSEGAWMLDGGGSRHCLDGRWQLQPRGMLDGTWNLGEGRPLASAVKLGERLNCLDGSLSLSEGRKLDGSWTLALSAPSRYQSIISEWKNGRLERRWLT